jgi:pimeloyl-ACP methyl ester carboxylesterase
MTQQIVRQLRGGSYRGPSTPAFSRVGLMGHSAGSEIVELAAGLYPKLADVLIATAYTHEPFVNNQWLLREWIPNDNVHALQDDYIYFENDPRTRAKDFYVAANADADVIALDNEMANLTPSGEILSINPQPSRAVVGLIRIPVLLVLAGKDQLFPARFGANELRLFLLATDKTFMTVPGDGHTFMLHRDAPATNARIADWLAARPNALPAC